MVHGDAFTLKRDADPLIAEPAALSGDLAHTSAIDEVTGHLVSKNALLKALHERGIVLTQPRRKQKLNVWRGFPGIAGDNASFVVLSAHEIDGATCEEDTAQSVLGELVDMAAERKVRF